MVYISNEVRISTGPVTAEKEDILVSISFCIKNTDPLIKYVTGSKYQ